MLDPNTIELHILDKDYTVTCPKEDEKDLSFAARHLDDKMREIRSTGKIHGTERIAVMAALNITYEMLQQTNSSGVHNEILDSLAQKIEKAFPAL